MIKCQGYIRLVKLSKFTRNVHKTEEVSWSSGPISKVVSKFVLVPADPGNLVGFEMLQNLLMSQITTRFFRCIRSRVYVVQSSSIMRVATVHCNWCIYALVGWCEEKIGNNSDLIGITVAPSAPRVRHLVFADDSLLFLKANAEATHDLVSVIDLYCRASGQRVNLEKKSSVFLSKGCLGRRLRMLWTFIQKLSMKGTWAY